MAILSFFAPPSRLKSASQVFPHRMLSATDRSGDRFPINISPAADEATLITYLNPTNNHAKQTVRQVDPKDFHSRTYKNGREYLKNHLLMSIS